MLIRSGKSPLPALFLAIDTRDQVLHHHATVLLSTLDQLSTIKSHYPSIEKTTWFESYCPIFGMFCFRFVVRSRPLTSGLSFVHFCTPISRLYILIRWTPNTHFNSKYEYSIHNLRCISQHTTARKQMQQQH